ncbi:MAG: hypothetical protein RDV48_00665 [Candidatus Eremiobacteraeota bacterium]|nr:hypothetical protein [Candidatus Eremiobacteraeota bacterium]
MDTSRFYDKYKSVYCRHGAEKTVMLAFCELFTANCLEVKKWDRAGEPSYLYRLRSEASPALLHKVERLVAEELMEFRGFPQMLAAAKSKVKKTLGRREPGADMLDQRLFGRVMNSPVDGNPAFKEIITRALEQNAVQYHIEPTGC